jgi:hypothetical protein
MECFTFDLVTGIVVLNIDMLYSSVKLRVLD